MAKPQGFLAVPKAGNGPGVLVLHAWWGLNDTIKGFCARLADAGFVAFAPGLYHGKVADNVADAGADAYDEAAAKLAWERTLELLHRRMRGDEAGTGNS